MATAIRAFRAESRNIFSSVNSATHFIRTSIRTLAQQTPSDNSPNPATTPQKQMPRPVRPVMPQGTIMGPDGQQLKVVTLDTADVAGVASVDRGESNTSIGKSALLVGGDLSALLLFAAIGRANHGGVVDIETLQTALPFIIGWFVTAPFLGGFGPEAQGSDVKSAALTAAKCWALGTPLGLIIRGIFKGYMPPTPFIIVSMVTTAVLMVGWRSALAARTTKDAKSPGDKKDKSGNPFEFMQLLFSLINRW